MNVANLPEQFRELHVCKICRYLFREGENLGHGACRYHPLSAVPKTDMGSGSVEYPCCGFVQTGFKGNPEGTIFPDGCTHCDHFPLEGASVLFHGDNIQIDLPRDLNTSFYETHPAEYYLTVYDDELVEVFPMELHRKFQVPIPAKALHLATFATRTELETFLRDKKKTIQITIAGGAKEIAISTDTLEKKSVGLQYVRAHGKATAREVNQLPLHERRRAELLATYHNTWKEKLVQTESNVLHYHQPRDFIGMGKATELEGPFLLYQRAWPTRNILWSRRGISTKILF